MATNHLDWCECKDIDQIFLDEIQPLYERVRGLQDSDEVYFCYCPMCGVEIND